MGIGDIVVGGGEIRGEEKKKEKIIYKNSRKYSNKIKNTLNFRSSSQVDFNSDEAKLFLENSNWLKTKEAAEYLRTSPKQLRKWVYQGRVKAYKLLGKSLRFKKTELCLLIEGGKIWE